MNVAQRVVLSVGVLAVLSIGLYPPWLVSAHVVDRIDNKTLTITTKHEGFHLILKPPNDDDTRPFSADYDRLSAGSSVRVVGISHRIDLTTLSVELACVVLVILGVTVMCKTRVAKKEDVKE